MYSAKKVSNLAIISLTVIFRSEILLFFIHSVLCCSTDISHTSIRLLAATFSEKFIRKENMFEKLWLLIRLFKNNERTEIACSRFRHYKKKIGMFHIIFISFLIKSMLCVDHNIKLQIMKPSWKRTKQEKFCRK